MTRDTPGARETATSSEGSTLEAMGRGSKIPVAVLGATGTVGQRFVTLLDGHPWFEIVTVAASERSSGKRYRDAVRWAQTVPIPERVAEMRLVPADPIHTAATTPLVFSALDASVAGPIESEFAGQGRVVVSNARSHRMDADVPLLVPEVNAEHLELARAQGHAPGAVLTNPNCSTIGLVMALAPLERAFGVAAVHVVTLQAVSGAGLPGISSYEILDSVVPMIAGEEEKIESESRKILGRLEGGHIRAADLTLSAQCNRVPVVDGHTLCVSVGLRRKAAPAAVCAAWTEFAAEPQHLGLPSAPRPPLYYLGDDTPPQPRLHRDLGKGMAVAIGRLRPCPILDYRFVALSHNTLRGAAGGAVLTGELAVVKGLLAGATATATVTE